MLIDDVSESIYQSGSNIRLDFTMKNITNKKKE